MMKPAKVTTTATSSPDSPSQSVLAEPVVYPVNGPSITAFHAA